MSDYFPSMRQRKATVRIKVKDKEAGERLKERLLEDHPGAEGKIEVSEEADI